MHDIRALRADPTAFDADLARRGLPPLIVRRILREQDRLHPPAIVPPVRIMHAGRSVAPGVLPPVMPAMGLSSTGAVNEPEPEQTPPAQNATGSTAADQQA
ncbi:hypothetical protein JK182_15540, partial [Acetobacter okinawensis]|nr:hypothetical protein [Acetobacter okinawensis]